MGVAQTNRHAVSPGRHLLALALAAPVTTAIAVAIVLPLVASGSQRYETFRVAGLMFVFGSLVGYCVELILFLPLYAIIHRMMAATGWSVAAVGALAGALPSLLLSDGWRFPPDPIELVLSSPGLSALGALGGAIYWLFIRPASADNTPFSGLSGSQP